MTPAVPADTATVHRPVERIAPVRKFMWLLKREYWENKGGFLWAPAIAAAVSLLFLILGGGAGQWLLRNAGERTITMRNRDVLLSETPLSALLQQMSARELDMWQNAMNAMTLVSSFWPWLVMYFVVFFYLVGSLHDQRKDRSILFWKSMPVSDTLTVLSKVVSAVVVAPLITSGLTGALMLAFGVVISVLMLINDVDPTIYYWSQLDYPMLLASLVAWLPIHVLWALPTVGWLLLCSAWARSKPFLWATVLPILAGALVSWFDLLRTVDVASNWFWTQVVARLLTSAWAGMHMLYDPGYAGSPGALSNLASEDWLPMLTGWHLLASPQLWIGALAGVIMIVATIRIVRWRDEA